MDKNCIRVPPLWLVQLFDKYAGETPRTQSTLLQQALFYLWRDRMIIGSDFPQENIRVSTSFDNGAPQIRFSDGQFLSSLSTAVNTRWLAEAGWPKVRCWWRFLHWTLLLLAKLSLSQPPKQLTLVVVRIFLTGKRKSDVVHLVQN